MIHQNAEWRLDVGSQSVDTTKLKFIKHLSLAVRAGFTQKVVGNDGFPRNLRITSGFDWRRQAQVLSSGRSSGCDRRAATAPPKRARDPNQLAKSTVDKATSLVARADRQLRRP